MQRFLGVFILAVMVALLGHPAVSLPPIALLPILAVILPIASFYITVVPDEPQLCRAECEDVKRRGGKRPRRNLRQL